MKRYLDASKGVHFWTSFIVLAVLAGVFWILDRQHEKGPLGVHDSVALIAILLFGLVVAYPERLKALADLIRAWRQGGGNNAPPSQ